MDSCCSQGIWNANSLVRNLKPDCSVYFRRRYPLHYERLQCNDKIPPGHPHSLLQKLNIKNSKYYTRKNDKRNFQINFYYYHFTLWWFSTGVWATSSFLKSLGIFSVADLNNSVVWTISTRPVISMSSSPCTNPLVTVHRAPITIGIIVTFMFHSLFNSLARSMYLSFFSLFFNFALSSACNIMAEGLRFMPLGLVRLRTFRLSTWVG